MRLKLVLIVSLLAAMVGSGAPIAVILGVVGSVRPASAPVWLLLATFVLPLATILLACMFVYRHTAKRRKLQALVTGLLALLLVLGAFISFSLVTRPKQLRPQPLRGPTVPS
jgi:uncharacterized membrane protein